MKKKYKLKKDLPGIEAGTIIDTGKYFGHYSHVYCQKEIDDNPGWFEEIRQGIEYDKHNIYATQSEDGRVFKLHALRHEAMFCAIDDSECGLVGIQPTAQEAIRAAKGYEIQVFDTLSDFLKWCHDSIS